MVPGGDVENVENAFGIRQLAARTLYSSFTSYITVMFTSLSSSFLICKAIHIFFNQFVIKITHRACKVSDTSDTWWYLKTATIFLEII